MLDISISSYGNKNNKQFQRRHNINKTFNTPNRFKSYDYSSYIRKINNWTVRHEYLRATGNKSLLAEDYYIW